MSEELPISLALKRYDSYAHGKYECCGKDLMRNRRGGEGTGA